MVVDTPQFVDNKNSGIVDTVVGTAGNIGYMTTHLYSASIAWKVIGT